VKLTPTTAADAAASAVEFVQEKFGFDLPYSPESLIVIDAIIDKIKATGASEQQASGLLSGLGCYVGEVFVRHARASWRSTTEMKKMTGACRSSIVVALPNVTGCDVIGKVFKRYGCATTESVARLYERAVTQRQCSAPPDPDATGSRDDGPGERRDQ
jgi:hypothetical protein